MCPLPDRFSPIAQSSSMPLATDTRPNILGLLRHFVEKQRIKTMDASIAELQNGKSYDVAFFQIVRVRVGPVCHLVYVYRQRSQIAEFPHAWIKERCALRQFRCLGQEKTSMEATWACLS